MHYYQFNIGDYAKATRHLSNEEDLAYRRLMEIYYDSEEPLIKDVSKLSRLINMRDNQEDIKTVLEDFFVETDKGFRQSRIDSEIASYHAKAQSARANGKKGGRPKKPKANPEETQGKPKETQSVNLANPAETESKANHKPLTNNHKPLTKDLWPDGLNVDAWESWIAHRKKCKLKAYKTDSAMKKLISMGDEKTQALIIQQSIDNEYQGLFPVKAGQQRSAASIHNFDKQNYQSGKF